ncbi:MAG: RdgB/HAM1 family non-canonical purine NTP pyrophosphatase [Synechococcaceae cyanobacterium SM2_3_1]|nr:RdgB/HAM1 family non-canonical purine NTP pyrophosphatase [Synechococcaceae cyanobacterium SM2_3_1]
MTHLLLASDNPGKLKEFAHFFQTLPGSPWELHLKPADLQLQETGETFAANAQEKAEIVARATRSWSIADDSGLEVEALGGAPGVYSARYADTDPARMQRLLQELAAALRQQGKDPDDLGLRTARFACAIALCTPEAKVAVVVEGYCQGQILLQPQGSGGFGYDPLFWVPARQQSFAEMSAAEKQEISHRGQALALLRTKLLELG